MTARPEAPLIVQSDFSLLLEVASPEFFDARARLLAFAELVKSPEHVHTYRITPLSIWNACSAGSDADEILATLEAFVRYPVPSNVVSEVRDLAGRYGQLEMVREGVALQLQAATDDLAQELVLMPTLEGLLGERVDGRCFWIEAENRGLVKQALIKQGLPVRDRAGFVDGEPLEIELRERTASGESFSLRDYQVDAADSFHQGGTAYGGSGVIVLPCGAGKTIVGMACAARVASSTLILTTGITAVRQWIAELLDKTSLTEEEVGEYSGSRKETAPVTVATYHVLTYKDSAGHFPHMKLFDSREWGLIIYDEVHLLPAPVFQRTAGLQARRRLGLTATLVREDGLEDEVFALIGPKCVDVPWKELESEGWIATAVCTEVRWPMSSALRLEYIRADARSQFRVASENPDKLIAVREILERHPDEPTLVIGTYVDQLEELAEALEVPLITGSTGQRKREQLYAAFKEGSLRILVVSKVANFAVDLPDASLAIQVSGTFGSRQEEAQRLGRLLRPKPGENQAHFYTIISAGTREQEFALKRQLFLCEQGYEYRIEDRTTEEGADSALEGTETA